MFFMRPSPAWDHLRCWALDLETSGLDPRRDVVLSVGMVPVNGGVIGFGERWYTLVRPPEGAAIPEDGMRAHHILPGELDGAPAIAEVLPAIDRRLREADVLILHFASLDVGFLKRLYRAHGMEWPRLRVVDTLEMLLKLSHRRQHLMPHPTTPRTALPEAREDLGLPRYANHHALSDAVATAELFLALRAGLGARTLRDLA
jgi:DNA polymerase III subunit epsilon